MVLSFARCIRGSPEPERSSMTKATKKVKSKKEKEYIVVYSRHMSPNYNEYSYGDSNGESRVFLEVVRASHPDKVKEEWVKKCLLQPDPWEHIGDADYSQEHFHNFVNSFVMTNRTSETHKNSGVLMGLMYHGFYTQEDLDCFCLKESINGDSEAEFNTRGKGGMSLEYAFLDYDEKLKRYSANKDYYDKGHKTVQDVLGGKLDKLDEVYQRIGKSKEDESIIDLLQTIFDCTVHFFTSKYQDLRLFSEWFYTDEIKGLLSLNSDVVPVVMVRMRPDWELDCYEPTLVKFARENQDFIDGSSINPHDIN